MGPGGGAAAVRGMSAKSDGIEVVQVVDYEKQKEERTSMSMETLRERESSSSPSASEVDSTLSSLSNNSGGASPKCQRNHKSKSPVAPEVETVAGTSSS